MFTKLFCGNAASHNDQRGIGVWGESGDTGAILKSYRGGDPLLPFGAMPLQVGMSPSAALSLLRPALSQRLMLARQSLNSERSKGEQCPFVQTKAGLFGYAYVPGYGYRFKKC